MYFLVSVDVKFIGQRIVITLGKSDFCYFLTESSKEISVRLRQETIFANSLFVWSIYRSSICLSFSLSKKALTVRKTLNKGSLCAINVGPCSGKTGHSGVVLHVYCIVPRMPSCSSLALISRN